ncbi:type I-F CRISPR-associated protein Csy3 [Cedecea colo]|uniref:Type I-F CRISPR-associated protein Csy3 n=1 Tax=Cedecea colo TaxID=2552946 RepID=A0ABX0VKE1_9ENTR|nr:type I-F CRISPR-associated protein Csy3 [Cedecea colo]NIY47473.1 type I-F CRISPR-associated protein Csy3 [Cedecea colo]
MAKATTIKTASVLAFERKLANSDAVMFSGNWQGDSWQPVRIQEKAVRGTISNRLKNALVSDPAKLDAEIQKANLQRVDMAALPADADTLKMTFTLRVLGNLATPSVCNDKTYQNALQETIEGYIAEHGFGELALRYATNLANGRFLWRNRVGAEHIQVIVTKKDNGNEKNNKTWTFNAHDFSLRNFEKRDNAIQELAAEMEKGLKGDTFVLLNVEAFVRLGEGQEVFPSQELVLDSNSSKSKVLYQVNDVAALHSQKVGNALRTIDTWHPQVESLGAIAVEPYGSVTSRGIACRQPKDKMDFYTLLDNWVTKGDKPAAEQQHYVMAVLIRGGVFGEKSE